MAEKLELTEEQLKAVQNVATAILDEDKPEPKAVEEVTVERKKPTEVAAIEPAAAETQDIPVKFGATPIKGLAKQDDLKDFSIAKAVRGIAFGIWKDAGLEREWVNATRKELNIEGDAEGGFLVPEVLSTEFIDKLRATAVVRKAGAMVIPNAPQRLAVPKLTGVATVAWVGQSQGTTALTASNQTFGQIMLDLRRMAVVSTIDVDLIKFAAVSAETIVRNDLVLQMALAEDEGLIQGTGGDEPTGIYYHTEVGNTSKSNATPVFNDLLDMMGRIDANNGVYTGFIMHPNMLNKLRKSKTGTSEYEYITDLTRKPPNQVLGLPVYTTTQIPITLGTGSSTYILLANWANFVIAEGGNMEIRVLREAYATKLQIGILAVHRVDGQPRQPGEFEILDLCTFA